MQRTIILPVVLYGCEIWSSPLAKNAGRWCLRTGCTREIVPKREKVTGGWRKLYNEELITCTLHQMLYILLPSSGLQDFSPEHGSSMFL
jgi:hypothetical protein